MKFQKTMVSQVAAEIRQLEANASLPFVEVRLHTTYELNEAAHEATLSLYSDTYENTTDNIFRGDFSDAKVNLALSTYRGENKQFIAALCEELPLHGGYLSEKVYLEFDREGATDVSARFDFQDLLAALSTLESIPDSSVEAISELQALPFAVREAALKTALQAHCNSLGTEDDTTIYFASDIDEDKSSAEDEVYVYTDHRVLDANFDPIVRIDEDVFDAYSPVMDRGDILTPLYETEVDVLLSKHSVTTKSTI